MAIHHTYYEPGGTVSISQEGNVLRIQRGSSVEFIVLNFIMTVQSVRFEPNRYEFGLIAKTADGQGQPILISQSQYDVEDLSRMLVQEIKWAWNR